MRCSSCEKFVPNGEPEAEIEGGEDFSAEVTKEKEVLFSVSTSVRVSVPCGECGTDLKETSLEFEMEEIHKCKKVPKAPKVLPTFCPEGSLDVEPVDDFQTTDRHGKPIKNPRYQTHLYGATVSATVTCPFCKEEVSFDHTETTASSSMDEC